MNPFQARSIGVALRRVADATLRATFGLAIYKRQLKAVVWIVCLLYLCLLLVLMWLSAGRPVPFFASGHVFSWESSFDALAELARTYSSIFWDLAIVAVIGMLFLGAYRHGFGHAMKAYRDERIREIETSDNYPTVSIPLPSNIRVFAKLNERHFQFPHALQCTLDASVISSDTLFQSMQGGFDLSKLTLLSVKIDDEQLCLELGTCSFRDLNAAHYWAFFPIATESTDETDQRQKCLFDLTAPAQLNFALHLRDSIQGVAGKAPKVLAPNPLGLSVLLRVQLDRGDQWLMRERTGHVAADRRSFCAAVAGLVDVYPDFGTLSEVTSAQLVRQEFNDEVTRLISPALRHRFSVDSMSLVPLGLVLAPESNYQPELYFLATVDLRRRAGEPDLKVDRVSDLLTSEHSKKGEIQLIDDVRLIWPRLRPRDRMAIERFLPDALIGR